MRSARSSHGSGPPEAASHSRGGLGLGRGHLHALLERFAGLRSQVLDRVTEANTASERAVIGAVDALKDIVRSTSSHVLTIDELKARTAAGDNKELGELLRRQSESVAAFAGEMGRLTGEQSELASAALVSVAAITEAERTITQMVTASRLLALNAQIESVRAGSVGAAFRTVAEQMEALSHQIADANRLVGRLAGEMNRTLPRVAAQAQRMKQRSDAFSTDHSARLADVEGGVAGLRLAVAHTLDSGRSMVDTVMRLSRDALGHLQFQDRVAQALLAVDGDCWTMESELCQELGEDPGAIREPVLGSAEGTSDALDEQGGTITLF